jgi:hypothetical protein
MASFISDSDPVLKKTFDFENFLKTTGISTVLSGYNSTGGVVSTAFDFNAVQLGMRTFGDAFEANPNIELFLPKVPELLFDVCFDGYLVPYLATEYRQSFINLNVSHTTDLKKRLLALVEAVSDTEVFKNSTASDLKPDVGPITALPSATFFSFGQSLYNLTADFNADSFKSKIAPLLLRAFLPVFYYRYLDQKLQQCPADQAGCKRNFALGRLVFVYYVVMSLFLIVFSAPDKIKKYKAVTNDNDAVLRERKERLLHIMDAVLIKLGDRSLLASESGGSDQRPAELSQFYDGVKQLSLSNVKDSNDLTRIKDDIKTMQNNLANYNQMEALNLRNAWVAKVAFYVALFAGLVIVPFVVALTVMGHFGVAEGVSAVGVLLCLVGMWINHTRTPGDGGKPTQTVREFVGGGAA